MSINGLEITDVVIFPIKHQVVKAVRVVAFARVVLNDSFAVSGLRVMKGEFGYFVAYPKGSIKPGEQFLICSPLTDELKSYISDQILTVFSKENQP